MGNQVLRFGAFLPPVHPIDGSVTLSIRDDIALIEHLDRLDFHEVWVGEHHSGGYELVPAPDLLIAAAAERAPRIRLGTGVHILPFHNPLILLNRFLQLDHQTSGRVMLGVGPGGVSTDAASLGIDPELLRDRCAEAVEVISELLAGETVTRKTDWFVLDRARCAMAPYNPKGLEMAVSATSSPFGPELAGRYGMGILGVGSVRPGDFLQHRKAWEIAETSAAQHSKSVSRDCWRLATYVHVAETRERALQDLLHGAKGQFEYWSTIWRFPADAGATPEAAVAFLTDNNVILACDPDGLVRHIRDLQEGTGGFGCFLAGQTAAVSRPDVYKSFELIARYVAPRFSPSLEARRLSFDEARREAPSYYDKQAKMTRRRISEYVETSR